MNTKKLAEILQWTHYDTHVWKLLSNIGTLLEEVDKWKRANGWFMAITENTDTREYKVVLWNLFNGSEIKTLVRSVHSDLATAISMAVITTAKEEVTSNA